MKLSPQKPKWWVLDLIFAFMLGLLALEAWLSHGETGHEWMLLIIIVVGYGLVALWTHANRTALSQLSDEEHRIHQPLRLSVHRTRANSLSDKCAYEELHDKKIGQRF